MLVLSCCSPPGYLVPCGVRRHCGQWRAGARSRSSCSVLGSGVSRRLRGPASTRASFLTPGHADRAARPGGRPLFLAMGQAAYADSSRPTRRASRPRQAGGLRRVRPGGGRSLRSPRWLCWLPADDHVLHSWYTHVFTSGTVLELTYLILIAPCYCVPSWTLLRVDPVPGVPLRPLMLITAAEVVGDAFLASRHRGPDHPRPAHYHSGGYPYGPSCPPARSTAAAIPPIWILGDSSACAFPPSSSSDDARGQAGSRGIDSELDARDAAARPDRRAGRGHRSGQRFP